MSDQSPARDEIVDGPGPDAADLEGPGDGVSGGGTGAEPRVLGLESADAEDVIGAVSSDTARSVLDALHEDPGTASGLADRLDASLQTVQYHLGNLEEADLVDVVDARTSEKGREMDVYGPADGPVVVFAGDGGNADDLRAVLRRLAAAVGFLGVLSLLVQEVVSSEGLALPWGTGGDDVQMTADAVGQSAPATGVEPGLVFFAGGLVVLAASLGVWYLRRTGTLERLGSST